MTSPTDLPMFAARASDSDGRPRARRLAGLSGGSDPVPQASTSTAASVALGATAITPGELGEDLAAPASSPATQDDGVDPRAVRLVRAAVTEAYRTQTQGESRLDPTRDAELVTDIIEEQVSDYSNRRIDQGQEGLSPAQRRELAIQVRHALFGLGRIAPLLEMDGVQDVEIEGFDRVVLKFADGRVAKAPPVADSDEQLIEDIAHLARTCPTGEKDFSPATKKLRMTLPDGSRLSAEAWATHRPSVHIRTHRLIDTTLDESMSLGVVDEGLAQFLAACIRAGRNIIIAGAPFAGKTTLARAILNALHAHVRIATIESQYELLLHQMPESRHLRVWAAEAQEGGEIRADGSAIGALSNADLIALALQKNADRLVVGEVTTGAEALAMIQALQTSKGSLATVHAGSAWKTVARLASLVQLGATNIDSATARSLVVQNVDVIVHIETVDETPIGGRFHRYVDDVIAVDESAELGGIEVTELWRPGPDGRATPTGQRPAWLPQLQRHGFDAGWLTAGAAQWTHPLDLLVPNVGRPS